MKILVLTSIYVGEDISKEFTPVVHYFTKEWVKMGHEVIVIHNVAYYPKVFYLISFFFSKLISSITGTYIPKKRLSHVKDYFVDDVKVFRLPLFKVFPHFKFSKKIMRNQNDRILRKILNVQFNPDYIVGHWTNPQLELLYSLKKNLTNVKTALVMHDGGESLMKLYKKESYELIKSIDFWGFRSNPIKNKFEAVFGKKEYGFLCYSGIPAEFIEQDFDKKFDNKLKSFLFVGALIKRKYPVKIIDALTEIYDKNDFILNYIGSGNEGKQISRIIKREHLESCVKLNGFLPRNTVKDIMIKTDCFIMISKDEAYGLVYLEAMAAGCITIASKDEGFDGVIEHGKNGFLCEAGNEVELKKLIEEINLLNVEDKQRISNNAILTASKLTNYNAAKLYLNNLNIV